MPAPLDNSLRSDATVAVHRLRRALAELIASTGADASEPQELSRRFHLDRTLMWRVSRAIREENALEAIAHLPGRPSIGSMLTRLEQCGASPQAVSAVREAAASFDRFVEIHSGDRETLAMMLGRVDRPGGAKQMELFRKQGFRANSAIWGVQAKVQYTAQLLTPGDDTTLCVAIVVGFVDFRRLRPDVPWTIGMVSAWNDSHTSLDAEVCAVYPEDSVDGVPVLPSFSSSPLPGLRARRVPSGGTRFEITQGTVGQTGAVTTALAWRVKSPLPAFASYPGEHGEHGATLSTPVELLIHDFLVHRSLDFALKPTVAAYSRMPGGPEYPAEGPDVGRIPLPDQIASLGCPPGLTTVEIPKYGELMQHVVKGLGFALDDFHAFRRRVKYPAIPAMAIYRHPLRGPVQHSEK